MFGLISHRELMLRAHARSEAQRMIELGGVFLDTLQGTTGTGPFWDGLQTRKSWEMARVIQLRSLPRFTVIAGGVQWRTFEMP